MLQFRFRTSIVPLSQTCSGSDFNFKKLKSRVSLPFSTTTSGKFIGDMSLKSSGHDMSICEVLKSGLVSLAFSSFLKQFPIYRNVPQNGIRILDHYLHGSTINARYGVFAKKFSLIEKRTRIRSCHSRNAQITRQFCMPLHTGNANELTGGIR